jgi:organic hydroperoxide reductase OsmC/OhrA
VTRREDDGRYAFVSVEVEIDAAVSVLDEAQRTELAERAEQGCFVGASLTAEPLYTWRLG